MSSAGCEHEFCNNCWSKYLEVKILDEGMGENITCPAHNCTILLHYETCLNLLKNCRAEEVYKTIIKNSFVDVHTNLKWCSGSGCTFVIKYNINLGEEPVVCKCGVTNCFSCGNNWHMPVECDLFVRWLQKCQDDSETSNWITINTKNCPSCHATIEKDGGCNHVICTNKTCKYEFCWICMGIWSIHKSSYNCNHFDEEEAQAKRSVQEIIRKELERYVFYYNRYINHKRSLELEQQLHASVNDKIKKLVKKGISWVDLQFLSQSVYTLSKCRSTLMYTYPFAYYLVKNNHCVLFHENQNDLQNAIERLSGYLERSIETDNYEEIKRNVIDLKIYCEGRRKKLEVHILEGYKEKVWEYRLDNIDLYLVV